MKSYKAGDRVSKWEMSTLDYCDAGVRIGPASGHPRKTWWNV